MNKELTLETKYFFKGRILKLRVDQVQLENGVKSQREIVEHPGAVAIVALDENNNVLLVTQFRKPMEKEILEIPAGKLEAGEDPLECAKRELLEETGYEASFWKEIFTLYTSPGFSNEVVIIYLAKGLHQVLDAPMDAQEISKIDLINMDVALDMIKQNKIKDGKTVAGILAVKLFYHDENVS